MRISFVPVYWFLALSKQRMLLLELRSRRIKDYALLAFSSHVPLNAFKGLRASAFRTFSFQENSAILSFLSGRTEKSNKKERV